MTQLTRECVGADIFSNDVAGDEVEPTDFAGAAMLRLDHGRSCIASIHERFPAPEDTIMITAFVLTLSLAALFAQEGTLRRQPVRVRAARPR